MAISTRIQNLIKALSQGLYEKEHIMAMTLLATVAGESVFLIGPPGTAKSLVARRLKMAFKEAHAFEYLMSRFSTPDEIFGPVSISALKNEDRYERVVEGFLPTATVVFLDEIWKAGPSIQNALLTALNEHLFQNGRDTLHLPMRAMIAASNELPAEGEGLEALWDRFLVRLVSNCIGNEATFFKMIQQGVATEVAVPSELLLDEAVLDEWQREIGTVAIGNEVCDAVSHIRRRLKEEATAKEADPMEFYVSDRRWKKCFRLLQTAAFLNGQKTVGMEEVPLLIHCLWNKDASIPKIIDIVCSSITATIDDRLDKMEKSLDKSLQVSATAPATPLNRFLLTDYFYYRIMNPTAKYLFYKSDYEKVPTNREREGLIYQDESRQAWVIHVIDTGRPFAHKTNAASKAQVVQLRRCDGGIIIDGIPYAFERTDGPALTTTPGVDELLQTLYTELVPALATLQTLFERKDHLFLSNDDRRMVRKQLAKCKTHLQTVEVKLTNAKQLK